MNLSFRNRSESDLEKENLSRHYILLESGIWLQRTFHVCELTCLPLQIQGSSPHLEEKGSATHSSILGLPCGSAGKESTWSVGDLGLITGLGRYPGERKGYPLQNSGLENSMDYTVHGVTKSWTWLRNFHFPHLVIFCLHSSWRCQILS